MSAMAFQIIGTSTVYSAVCSGADKRKHKTSASLAFYAGNSPVTFEFLAQKASYAEIFHLIMLMTSSCYPPMAWSRLIFVSKWSHWWWHRNPKVVQLKEMLLSYCYFYTLVIHQSGRSPKIVALFSATDFSSYVIDLLPLHNTLQLNAIMHESTII